MYIHEAICATTAEKPYIARKAWNYLTAKPTDAAIKLLPTDSPDGCIILSAARKNPCHGWQPTAGDLIADDWETVWWG